MKKILAIDDQKDNLTTIAAVIKTNLPNCEVLTALSGKEGIEIARKEQPDTILLDIIMPGMDGFEVCAKLKEDELTKHIPVIMLTAIKTDAKSRVKGLDIGADAFLAKPIDSVELSSQVNVMLRIKEAEDKLREEKLNLEELVEKKTKGLIESEFKFRNIIQQSDDGISISDEEGIIIEWNKSLEKITGIKEKDVLGKYIWDVQFKINEKAKQTDDDYLKLKNTILNLLKTANADYSGKQMVRNYQHPDGTLKFIQGSVFPIKTNKGFMLVSLSRDVTKEKLSEEIIRKSEEKYRTIFESTGTASMIVDDNTTILQVNNECEKITGFKNSELVGTSWIKYVDKSDLELMLTRQQQRSVVPDSVPYKYEVKLIDAKGKIRNTILNIGNIPDTNMTVVSLLDITDRKEAENALQESEKRFKELVEVLPEAVFETDENFTLTYINKQGLEISAYTEEDVSKGLYGLDLIAKEDQAYAKENIAKRMNGINPGAIQYTGIKKDGSTFQMLFHANSIIKDGKFAGIKGIIVDITERIKTENALIQAGKEWQMTFDSSKDIIWILDKDNNILQSNKAAEEFFKKSRNAIIGKKCWEIVHLTKSPINGCPDVCSKQSLKRESIDLQIGEFWYKITVDPILNSKGQYDGSVHMMTDITERKLSEQEIKKMAQMLDIAPNSITVHDFYGNFLFANQKTFDLHGYTKDEFLALPLDKLDTPETAKMIPDRMKKIAKEGEALFEVEHYKKDGNIIPLEVLTMKTKWGDMDAMISVATDITERKKAAELLRKSEEKFRLLATNTLDTIWTTDKEFNMTYVNSAVYEFLGYTTDEFLGLNPAIFTTDEGIKIIQEKAKQLIEKHKEGEIVQSTFEVQQIRKDGKIIDVEITSNLLLDNSGQFIGFQGRSIDITELKYYENIKKVIYNITNESIKSESLEKLIRLIRIELANIIDTTNFYVALYDSENDTLTLPFISDTREQGKVIPAGKTLTKYVINTKKSLLATNETIEELVKSNDIVRSGANSKIWLGVPLTIDKKVIGVLTIQSYTDENAYNSSDVEMLEFVSKQISISINRKKAEEDLKIALEKATESERLKSAFLTNMSHEIRTPMNGILGFTNLLKEPGLTGEEQQEYIEIIERSGDRMLNTINDIMDISMIESDQVKTSIKNVNINEETNTLFSFFKPEVEQKGMSFKLINTLGNSEATIKTDKEKVYAILTNLIKNSIKYSKKGSIEFGYNLIPDKLFPTIEFYVKDTGIGIPKDRQKAVFDRFVQADIEDKEVYEGSGLGLAISKAYVEMLGGEMWVESEVGVGTTFYFTLPYHIDKKEKIESKEEKSDIKQDSQDKKLKILIAEDEEFADLHLSILLKNTAKEILHAKNGLEVIEIFQKNPGIDLILMDIKMPKMGGHEATRQIRKFNKDVVIIAQTAYALEGDYEKAIEAGCDDYISKPINKDELMEKIGKLVKSH